MAMSMEEIEFLARRAGLVLTAEQKAKLLKDFVGVVAASDRVHGVRPFTTEPVTAFAWDRDEEA